MAIELRITLVPLGTVRPPDDWCAACNKPSLMRFCAAVLTNERLSAVLAVTVCHDCGTRHTSTGPTPGSDHNE